LLLSSTALPLLRNRHCTHNNSNSNSGKALVGYNPRQSVHNTARSGMLMLAQVFVRQSKL
jgi:hypothetical protein